MLMTVVLMFEWLPDMKFVQGQQMLNGMMTLVEMQELYQVDIIKNNRFLNDADIRASKNFLDGDDLKNSLETNMPGVFDIISKFEQKEAKVKQNQLNYVNMSTAYNQTIQTDREQYKSYIDPDTVVLENAIGTFNKQLIFTDRELDIFESVYEFSTNIEDQLYSRIYELAKMTALAVYSEDNPKRFQNPQYHSLVSFRDIQNGNYQVLGDKVSIDPLEFAYSKQDNLAIQMSDEPLENTSIGINTVDFNSMSDFFQKLVTRPQTVIILKEIMQFYFRPVNTKNTTFYVNHEHEEWTGPPPINARISAKHYMPRFPKLHDKPYDPYAEGIYYDNKSAHFKELSFFDDMIKKINDEKEIWPGIRFQDQNGNNIAATVAALKAKQEESKQHQKAETCELPQAGSGFNPPFASHQREIFIGPSVHMYPIREIELTEKERQIEKLFEAKAISHNKNTWNFIKHYFQDKLGNTADNKNHLQKMFFTYDDPNTIEDLTNGIMPKNIKKLSSKNGHYKFFTQNVNIQFPKDDDKQRNKMKHLMPQLVQFTITNPKETKETDQDSITIHSILTSTPEVQIQINGTDEEVYLPIELKPQESLTVNVIMTPQNLGSFDCLIYVLLEQRIFIKTFFGSVVPNKYGLEPIFYLTHQRDEINHPIVVANPGSKSIYVEEFYITNHMFKADFKKSNSKQKNQPNFIIEANSNRTFVNIIFQPDHLIELDETQIVIKFSNGDFVRVPMYVRNRNDLIQMTPSVIDFGLVQLGQKPMKFPVYIKWSSNVIKQIIDVYLPLDQPNLDFQIEKLPDKTNTSHVLLGHVFLNPVKAGFIASSIKLEVATYESFNDTTENELTDNYGEQQPEEEKECNDNGNFTMFVELPILGSIVDFPNMLSAVDFKDVKKQQDFEVVHPLYIMDPNQPVFVRKDAVAEQVRMIAPFIIKNNLNDPITIQRIYDKEHLDINTSSQEYTNRIFNLTHHSVYTQTTMKMQGLEQSKGEIINYAGLSYLKNQPFRQGYQLLWLKINKSIVPVQVQILSENMFCQWLNSTYIDSLQDIQLCQFLTNISFGDMQLEGSKEKILRITNVNSVPVTMETFMKTWMDDLIISFVKMTDRHGKEVVNPDQKGMQLPFEIMGHKRTRKIINLEILPFQTAWLSYRVNATRVMDRISRLTIKFVPFEFGWANTTYTYNIREGSLNFQPAIYKFLPAFQGMPQTKILTARSNYSQAVEIYSVTSPDPRIEARVLSKEIKPWNMSISGMITFDAGKTGTEKHSEFIKQISQFSIDNPPTLQIDAFNLQKMQARRSKNGQQVFDFYNKFQTLSDKEILQIIKKLENEYSQEDGNDVDTSSIINMSLKERASSINGKNSTIINIPLKDTFNSAGSIDFEHITQGKSHVNKQNTGLFASPDKDFKISESINYRDILAWRERQEEWKQLERNHKTQIKTELQIKTSLDDQITIPIEASLKKPQIATVDSLDFGALQIGDYLQKDIVIHNPTSETITLQLFLSYDLDKSFVAKKTHKLAWQDRVAFHDKMLRQIDIYMKGVERKFVSQVEYMFDKFKEQKANVLDINFDKFKSGSKRDIIDVLLDYSQRASSNFKTDNSSRGTIDELLFYFKQFDEGLENNYVGRYCMQLFLERGIIQNYDDFSRFFESETKDIEYLEHAKNSWRDFSEANRFFMSDKISEISQCFFAIEYVHELEKDTHDEIKAMEELELAAQKSGNQNQDHSFNFQHYATCHDHEFAIQSTQNFFRKLYLNVYDYDWKINNSMERCNLTMTLERLDNLNSVDEITSVLRSIFYHDTLQTWKRWQLATNRYQRSQVEAWSTRSGPLAQLQERYIYYLSNIVPFGHKLFERHVTQEERRGYEANIRNLNRVAEWFQQGKVQLEVQNPDQIQALVNKGWDLEIEQQLLIEEAKALWYRTKQGKPGRFGRFILDILSEAVGAICQFLAFDISYPSAQLAAPEGESIINPLSSLKDRFSLRNKHIQRAMVRNNVHSKFFAQSNRQLDGQANLPVQNFYLNPIYKDKVFEVPPRQNLTIKDAVIFEPQMIEQEASPQLKKALQDLQESWKDTNKSEKVTEYINRLESTLSNVEQRAPAMQLLIKNNLTIIEAVALNGYGTSGVLELTDIKKWQYYNGKDLSTINMKFSVQNSIQTSLVAFEDVVPPYSNMRFWLEQDETKHGRQWIDLEGLLLEDLSLNEKDKLTLFNIIAGTELHVINYLFDKPAQEEYHRNKSNAQQRELAVVDQILSQTDRQKAYLKKNDRARYSLSLQSFHNYVPFNIPLFEIFVKKNYEAPQTNLFYVDESELQWPESSIVLSDKDNSTEERHQQRKEAYKLTHNWVQKLKNYLDKPSNSKAYLKQQVAQALGRWDNQDFRVDINWTDFEYHALRNKINVIKDHHRFLEFTNSGAVPVKIIGISVDGSVGSKCGDFFETLVVTNCKRLIDTVVLPKKSIMLELTYRESFQFTHNQKVLEIQTEHFAQKFLLDFIIPAKAQQIAQRIESKYFWNDNNQESFSYFVQLCQSIFIMSIIYIIMIMAITMKRVFDDQVMLINGIFPILDAKKVKLKVNSDVDKPSEEGESRNLDLSTSIFCTIGGSEIISSLMTQKEIIQEYVAINHKMNSIHDVSKDFTYLAMTKHFTDVMPYNVMQQQQKNLGEKDAMSFNQFETSIMYKHYRGNNSKFKQSSSEFLNLTQQINQHKPINISEAQKLCSQARDLNRPNQQLQTQKEAAELEVQIMQEMSKMTLEEQKNTGIRFFKNESGKVTFAFVKLSDLPKEGNHVIKELDISESKNKAEQTKITSTKKNKSKGSNVLPVQAPPPAEEKKGEDELPIDQQISKKQKKQILAQQQQEQARVAAMLKQKEMERIKMEEEKRQKELQEKLAAKQIQASEKVIAETPAVKEDQEAQAKQTKVVRKMTKAELKKHEQRLKKEQALIENTKRLELLEEEAKQKEARLKAIQEQRQKEIELKKQQIEEEETRHLKDIQLEPSKPTQKVEEDVISIKSYHSSQKEDRRRDQRGNTKERPEMKQDAKIHNLLEPGHKRSISQGRVEQRQIDKNFWENYERNLGIVKEETEETPHIRLHTSPGQIHHSGDEAMTSPAMLNPQDMLARFSDHSLTRERNDNRSDGNSADEPKYNKHPQQHVGQHIQSSDSDDDLPLFQQKKYIQKQKEIQERLEQEQIAKNDKKDTTSSKSKPSQVSISEESKDRSTSKNTQNAPAKKTFDSNKLLSKDQRDKIEAFKRLGIVSKNPNADYNNPNNPNYKGRLANKILDSYLPKTKPAKEKVSILKDKEEPVDREEKKIGKQAPIYDKYYYEEDDYADDRYYKKQPTVPYPRRADMFYEDDRYGRERYVDDRDKYGRFGGPTTNPPTDSYYGTTRGRGRGRGIRGAKGVNYYEEEYNFPIYNPSSIQDRRFPSKYYQDEEYYYEDSTPKYDKRPTKPGQDDRDYTSATYTRPKKEGEGYKEESYYDKSQSKYKGKPPVDPADLALVKGTKLERGGFQILTRGRGTTRGGKESKYTPYGQTPEFYQFKAKEKEYKDASQYHKEARTISPSGAKEAISQNLKPVQKVQYFNKDSYEDEPEKKTEEDNLTSDKSGEFPQNQQSVEQESEEAEESLEEEEEEVHQVLQPEVDKESDDFDLNVFSGQFQQQMQNNHYEQEEESKAQSKSLYETFMNVNSIFSKNFLEPQQKQKSRFVGQLEQNDNDDDQEAFSIFTQSKPKVQPQTVPPVQNQQQPLQQQSIFGQGSLFQGTTQRQSPPSYQQQQPPQMDLNSIFSIFGQNFNLTQAQQQQQQRSPEQIFSNKPNDYFSNVNNRISPQGAAGLSSSSFANLRRRALETGHEQMMQRIGARETSQVSHNHGESLFGGNELPNFDQPNPLATVSGQLRQPPVAPQTQQILQQPFAFQGLGALPVPKFLQERNMNPNKVFNPQKMYDQQQRQISGQSDETFDRQFAQVFGQPLQQQQAHNPYMQQQINLQQQQQQMVFKPTPQKREREKME